MNVGELKELLDAILEEGGTRDQRTDVFYIVEGTQLRYADKIEAFGFEQ